MRPISFKRHRFPPDVIRYAVSLYFRFTLSFRDIEEMLADPCAMGTCVQLIRTGPLLKSLRGAVDQCCDVFQSRCVIILAIELLWRLGRLPCSIEAEAAATKGNYLQEATRHSDILEEMKELVWIA